MRGAEGTSIVSVDAIGKNLLVRLDDRTTFRVHLGMNGRWWWVPRGDPIRFSRGRISLLLEVDDGAAICTGAPTVERMRTRDLALHRPIAGLGPDVLAPDFDPEVAAERVASSPAPTLAELLLDQRVACGIGNVYKCEILFVLRVDPFAAPTAVPRETLRALYIEARRMMSANLARGPRVTTGLGPGRPAHWVYGRRGRPCLRCGTPVASRVHGTDLPRTTWYCPRCQQQPG